MKIDKLIKLSHIAPLILGSIHFLTFCADITPQKQYSFFDWLSGRQYKAEEKRIQGEIGKRINEPKIKHEIREKMESVAAKDLPIDKRQELEEMILKSQVEAIEKEKKRARHNIEEEQRKAIKRKKKKEAEEIAKERSKMRRKIEKQFVQKTLSGGDEFAYLESQKAKKREKEQENAIWHTFENDPQYETLARQKLGLKAANVDVDSEALALAQKAYWEDRDKREMKEVKEKAISMQKIKDILKKTQTSATKFKDWWMTPYTNAQQKQNALENAIWNSYVDNPQYIQQAHDLLKENLHREPTVAEIDTKTIELATNAYQTNKAERKKRENLSPIRRYITDKKQERDTLFAQQQTALEQERKTYLQKERDKAFEQYKTEHPQDLAAIKKEISTPKKFGLGKVKLTQKQIAKEAERLTKEGFEDYLLEHPITLPTIPVQSTPSLRERTSSWWSRAKQR
jgi:hypothetical protein